jgi:putative serine protease PepD
LGRSTSCTISKAAAATPGLARVVATPDRRQGAGEWPSNSNEGTAQALEQDFTRVVHATLPSVMEIVSPSVLGSGVIFDDKGHVVTNAHVVGKSASFEVRPSTGTRTYPATLVGFLPIR